MENAALFCHLLGAFLFVSGTGVAGVAFEVARRRESPAEIAVLLGLARIAAVLVMAGVLLTLGFGLWLVELEHRGYGTGWIDAALGLLVAALVLGAAGGQAPKRARRLAVRLAGEQRASEQLRALLDDRVALAANYLSAVLVLTILALMVWKPGAGAG